MAFDIVILPRAERDIHSIYEWIAQRSAAGAVRWWTAFEAAASRSADRPLSCPFAPESEELHHDLRQFLFSTPHGRTYRGVFVVVDEQIRILRVRGPGQPDLDPDELA